MKKKETPFKKLSILKILISLVFLLSFGQNLLADEYSLTAVNNADGSIEVTFDLLVEPTLAEVPKGNQFFTQLENLTDFNKSTRQGYPEVLSKKVALSTEEGVEYSIKIVESEFEKLHLIDPYIVGRGTITRNQNPEDVPYVINDRALNLRKYPGSIIQSEESFLLRNVSGQDFTFNVTQFKPRNNKVKVFTHLKFLISPNTPGVANAQSNRSEKKVSAAVKKIMPHMFLNYRGSRAESYEVADYGTVNSTSRSTSERAINGDILVIYTSRDSSAIQPYINHKRNMGYTVHTRQVNRGTNVKSIIQSEYNSKPSIYYVQLVGDWEDIKSDIGTSQSAPMDPYMGCVSGNDNYPDIAIGRFSAASSSDVTTQVNKVIQYETSGVQSYWSKGLGIASDEGAGSGDDGEADFEHVDVIKEYKLIPNQYSQVTEIYRSGSASTVSSAVNSGLHLINYAGHGSSNSWVTTGFSSSDVNNLNNGTKLPIIFSVACVNGTFHQGTSFAETWLRKSNGGAVATVMATINQPWTPPMRGQDYMNDLLTGGYNYGSGPGNGTSTSSGKSTFGDIIVNAFNLMYSESSSINDLDTIQTWTIFGDASLLVVDDGSGGGGDEYDGELSLQLNTDKYGSETSWELRSSGGSLIDSGSGYNSYSSYTIDITVQSGDYVFTIFDSYGDGMTVGNGSYSLKDGSGAVIASGSNFGSQESTTFTVAGSSGKTYYRLQNVWASGYSVKASSSSISVGMTANSDTSDAAKWELVDAVDDGYFHFINVATKKPLRPDNTSDFCKMEQGRKTARGLYTQWTIQDLGGGIYRLINRKTGKFFRPDSNTYGSTISQVPSGYTGSRTKWKLIPVN